MTLRDGVAVWHTESMLRTAESSARTHLHNHADVDLADLGVQSRCCSPVSSRASSAPCHRIARGCHGLAGGERRMRAQSAARGRLPLCEYVRGRDDRASVVLMSGPAQAVARRRPRIAYGRKRRGHRAAAHHIVLRALTT